MQNINVRGDFGKSIIAFLTRGEKNYYWGNLAAMGKMQKSALVFDLK